MASDHQGQRIDPTGALQGSQRFGEPDHLTEVESIPVIFIPIWIQFESVLVFCFRRWPVPIVLECCIPENCMRFRQLLIQLHGSFGSSLSFFKGSLGRNCSVESNHGVGIGKADISRSIDRILLERLLEIINRLTTPFFDSLIQIIASAKVELVSFASAD